MNKELREDLEHLIICNDKSITQDLIDDVKMTLDYIDELENKINKAIKKLNSAVDHYEDLATDWALKCAIKILRGEE